MLLRQMASTIAFVIIAISPTVSTAQKTEECPNIQIKASVLQLLRCESEGEIKKAIFATPLPSSAYSTDHDRIFVVIATAPNLKRLTTYAGFIRTNGRKSFQRVTLPHIPFQEQVGKISVTKRIKETPTWNIGYALVQYANQGGALGFEMDCATALSANNLIPIAVASCFGVGGESRFLETLNQVVYESR